MRIWDATTGRKILTLTGTQIAVWPSVAFSPDGHLLAYADNDRSVKVWDATTGRRVHTLHGHSAAAYAVAFSPDGQTLASAGDDKTVKLWDVATGQELLTLKGHIAPVHRCRLQSRRPEARLGRRRLSSITVKRGSGMP